MTMAHGDSYSQGASLDNAVGGYLDAGNSGSAKTVDFTLAPSQKVTLTASAPTIALKAGLGLRRVRLLLAQDATGSRLLPTFSPAANYGTAGAPTLTTTASKIDIIDLLILNGTTVFAMGTTKGF